MGFKVLCDQCGADAVPGTSTSDGWLHLAPLEGGEGGSDVHVCGVTCLARWAEAHGAQPVKAKSSGRRQEHARLRDSLGGVASRSVDLRTMEADVDEMH